MITAVITAVSGVVIGCDGCDQDWWQQWSDGGAVVWASDVEALAALGDAGWRFTGPGRAFCPTCYGEQLCGEDGHDWLPSAPCHCAGQLPGHLTPTDAPSCPEWVTCGRCGRVHEADLI